MGVPNYMLNYSYLSKYISGVNTYMIEAKQTENINIEKMDMKIIKELSSGGNGTAYLVERGGEQLVYKLEKMDVFDETTPLQSEYYRQIDFNKNIAINHPDKFLVLKSHGIIFDCEYVHPKTESFNKNPDENRKKRFIRKNSQPNCYFLLYSPFLEGTYRTVRNIISKNQRLFLDFMYQIIDSINIMRKEGYSQNDPSFDNFMYKKNGDNYQWYIIDYGNACHKKFPISELDKDIGGRTFYCMDLVMFIHACISIDLFEYMKQHKILANFGTFITNIKKEPEYNKIIAYIPQSVQPDQNKKLYNRFTEIITKIQFPKIYLKCVGASEELYINYTGEQLYPEILLYCLEHCDDVIYDDVLRQIKKYNIFYGGYIKYKTKYLNLKNTSKHNQIGGNETWIEQEEKQTELLKLRISDLLWEKNPHENTNLKKRLVRHNIKNTEEITKNEFEFKQLIKSFKRSELLFLEQAEHLDLIQKNKIPNINTKQIDQYIEKRQLSISYSISSGTNIYSYREKEIHAMHSIGKVFTGFLIILLINDNTINEKYLNKPIRLDKNVLNKLSLDVQTKLAETTFLDCMTHKTGLKNYLTKYFDAITTSINKNTLIPNPIEPEDYLIYADDDISEKTPHYSNLGLLLVGLSLKYHYNKKHNTNLSYNQILNMYIINKIGLDSFSVTKPDNAKYNNDDNAAPHLNGSPGGGYWISTEDLRKFGDWTNKKYNENNEIQYLVKKYGEEFYSEDKNAISHSGGISSSDAMLATYLDSNITISIMSDKRHAMILYDAIMMYK